MVPPETFSTLAARGVRVLGGVFVRGPGGWDLNYGLDGERSEHLSRSDALKDFGSGIVFSKIDLVVNNTPIDRIAPALEALAADPGSAEVMDLLTHEQYSWDFHRNHIPDHGARIEAAIRWVTEHGYEPVCLEEGFYYTP